MFVSSDTALKLISNYENKDEILDQLQNLSPAEELAVLANLIGYTSMPVDIETFVKDPYYLGDIYGKTLYPIWLERLKETYPDPIRTNATFISVAGAIGVGKSVFSTICSLYDYYKCTLIRNLGEFLHLAENSVFTFRFFNISLPKAYDIFINPIKYALEESPYFKEFHAKNGGYAHGIQFLPASLPRQILSEVVLGCVISEVNFFRKGMAQEILSTVISRMESRLQMAVGYLPHVFLDSSSTAEDSAQNDFVRNSPYSDELVVYNTSIWEAKRHLGIYFNEGSFNVYAGDSEVSPFILDKPIEEYDAMKLDRDRIIACPNEVRKAFELDIEKALQEKCGISTQSTDNFIIDKNAIKQQFCLPHLTHDVEILDFYDDETLMDIIGDAVEKLIPKDRKLFVRVDLGLVHDHTGISICHFDGMKTIEFDHIKKPMSTFKVPIAFGLSRKAGQETPINKIRDFIFALNKKCEIALFSTDQFQSSGLRQEVEQAGIPTRLYSVDRTDRPYQTMKELLMQNRVQVCNNKKALKELLDLKRIGKKIDHTSEGINSKDIMDSICGNICLALEAGKEAADVPKQYLAKKFSALVESTRLSKQRKDYLKNPLERRNFWG